MTHQAALDADVIRPGDARLVNRLCHEHSGRILRRGCLADAGAFALVELRAPGRLVVLVVLGGEPSQSARPTSADVATAGTA